MCFRNDNTQELLLPTPTRQDNIIIIIPFYIRFGAVLCDLFCRSKQIKKKHTQAKADNKSITQINRVSCRVREDVRDVVLSEGVVSHPWGAHLVCPCVYTLFRTRPTKSRGAAQLGVGATPQQAKCAECKTMGGEVRIVFPYCLRFSCWWWWWWWKLGN